MRFWNPKNVPFPFDGDDDKAIVEHYIRDKYILGKFRYDEIKPEDFGSRMDDFDGESDRFDERNRSRSRSRSHSFYKRGHNRSDYGGSRDSFQSTGQLQDMGFGEHDKKKFRCIIVRSRKYNKTILKILIRSDKNKNPTPPHPGKKKKKKKI
ncbi:CFC_collapsed_G0018200.mRNA.1.CDS.1 [Saccharomyces cerevisiae]|nr:CFC_collapsed_G0018200.mRNA.1.CDS.1 [Saccharomyces cerevisiae]